MGYGGMGGVHQVKQINARRNRKSTFEKLGETLNHKSNSEIDYGKATPQMLSKIKSDIIHDRRIRNLKITILMILSSIFLIGTFIYYY